MPPRDPFLPGTLRLGALCLPAPFPAGRVGRPGLWVERGPLGPREPASRTCAALLGDGLVA